MMMLIELRIGQIGLVDEVIMSFGPGLTVLTGETGAGKSMIGTALSLLSGGRAPRDLVRAGVDEGYVEGIFDFSADESRLDMLSKCGIRLAADGVLVLRREIKRHAKSRVLINGLVSSLGLLERIGPQLLSIQSQDQQRELASTAFAGLYLDDRLGLVSTRRQLGEAFEAFNVVIDEIALRRREAAAAREQLDMWRFQFQELEQLGLREDEEAELDEALNLLRHAGELQTGAAAAIDLLSEGRAPLVDGLGEAIRILAPLAGKSQKLAVVDDLLRQASDSASEAALDLNRFLDTLDLDAGRLEELEERRALYDQMKRKYGQDVPGLIRLRARLQKWLARQENASSDIAEMENDRDEKLRRLNDLAETLHSSRLDGSASVQTAVRDRVRSLGLPEIEMEFSVDLKRDEQGAIEVDGHRCRVGPGGADTVSLLVRTNPGENLGPVASIASGGEKSRIYLGLTAHGVAEGRQPLMLFDEIDAGLGMDSAATMADMLEKMAIHGQVVVITHWPTMAVRGTTHYRVTKIDRGGRNVLNIDSLVGEDRTDEVARLLGGVEATGDGGNAQRTYARQLLAGNRRSAAENGG